MVPHAIENNECFFHPLELSIGVIVGIKAHDRSQIRVDFGSWFGGQFGELCHHRDMRY